MSPLLLLTFHLALATDPACGEEQSRWFLAGRLEDAIAACTPWVAEHPEDPVAQLTLGRALAAKGDCATAREHLEQVRALDTSHRWPYAWASATLGSCAASEGHRDEARTLLLEVRDLRATANVTATANRALLDLGLDPS